MMGEHRLELAEALLAKARSTSFDGERDSFVAGAYTQLGAFLGAADRPARSDSVVQRPAVAGRHRPAGTLPAGPAPAAEPAADIDMDEGAGGPGLVIDLAAAERAYRGMSAGRPAAGALVDLTI